MFSRLIENSSVFFHGAIKFSVMSAGMGIHSSAVEKLSWHALEGAEKRALGEVTFLPVKVL